QIVMIGGEARGSLLIFPLDGSAPREIMNLEKKGSFRSLEWTPDGQSVIASKVGPEGFGAAIELWRFPIAGGAPQKIDLKGASPRGDFSIHPDGHRIAFTSGDRPREVWAIENFLPLLQAKQ